uniref:Uncharacterized protein n=1 Tax=Molossus molossus TaxID=27622 RepID=A0A7J8I995_MOLMO|nr:hypothetical protein HJG59_010675 [Molossus molossus]
MAPGPLSLGPSSPPPPATILPHPCNTPKKPNFTFLHPEGDDTYLLQSTLVPDPTPEGMAPLESRFEREDQTCSVCVPEPPNPSSCPRPNMLRPLGHGLCLKEFSSFFSLLCWAHQGAVSDARLV